MDTRNAIDSEALLREVGWVRALARRLIEDGAEAEDVAQEAMVVALRGTWQEPRALRQWLGAVVRNLSRNARRRGAVRGRREGPFEDGEGPSLPSTLELVEKAATQRELVGALLELSESDRAVLLLHYFEGASNEAIARRWGVPASTVASRLARAHQRLRAKWLAKHGDEPTGMAALVLLARAARLEPGIASGIERGADELVRHVSSRWPSTWPVAAVASVLPVLIGAMLWLCTDSRQRCSRARCQRRSPDAATCTEPSRTRPFRRGRSSCRPTRRGSFLAC